MKAPAPKEPAPKEPAPKEPARKATARKGQAARFASLLLSEEQRIAFLDAIRGKVASEHFQFIENMVEAFPELLSLLEQKGMSIARLRRVAFGAPTEKSAAVCPEAAAAQSNAAPKGKRKGHGRRPASSYSGARRVAVSHPTLQAGELCPDCKTGKLCLQPKPAPLIRMEACPPVSALLFELGVLRCWLCGKTFTAPAPKEAGTEKYAPSVGVMVGLLRYGSGMPFYRLEQFQKSMGVPLAASIQWELAEAVARTAEPVLEHLKQTAAQAPNVFNDDTNMRVGELRRQIRAEAKTAPGRTGIFTTGIVAKLQDHLIALFFTGRQHAGERLDEVLRHRDTGLSPPAQMCDGLSRNEPKEFQTLVGCCLAHGRRSFVEATPNFPQECRHVLESLRELYRFDAQSKAEGHCPQQRLSFHQRHSQPVMEALKAWFEEQIEHKRVEPNSGLGQAIGYMLRHWEALSLFLREPGAPLDNNICERALKMAIMHRKNSLSYKTQRGAQVGDLFMSLIHTCRLNGINPFDYLMALVGNAKAVAAQPGAWLPWNYQDALAAALLEPGSG